MADRPRGNDSPAEGTPEYNWLYGRQEPASPDSEATEVFPGWGSPDAATSPAPATPPPPDRTQVLPVQQPYNQPPPPPQPPYQPPRQQQPYQQPPPPPTAPGHGPGRGLPLPRRPRMRFRPVRWVLLLLLLWLVFLVATPFWAWRSVDKVDAEPAGDRPGDQPGTTYLIVGSDSRQGLTKEERDELGTGNPQSELTDTIMLLHTGDGPNLLMSIPRDSIVNIPGYGESKINGAYGKGGPELVVQTIEQNTGIRVDHYVEIGLGGFVGLVDAVGGVEICPKQDMKDKKANLDIKKGCQEADGVTALGYSRSRKFATGDIERAEHQREVVSAVGKKAVSPWSVLNPIRYWKLNMAATDFITTDENTGPTKLAGFALAMTRLDGDNGMTCGVPIADLAVNWDDKRSKQMFEYIKNDETDKIGKLCNKSGLVTGP